MAGLAWSYPWTTWAIIVAEAEARARKPLDPDKNKPVESLAGLGIPGIP